MPRRLSLTALLCCLFWALVYGQTCPHSTCKSSRNPFKCTAQIDERFFLALGGFPALIEVTLEELETGLEAGEFTSVDLVNVCI